MSSRLNVTSKNLTLRPSRLNAAGWCIYCATRNCTGARCIANHARAEWEVCGKCGGSEWVDGHIDPETACQRCDCFGGLTEVVAPAAQVVELSEYIRTEPSTSYSFTTTGNSDGIGPVNVRGGGL